MKIQQSLMIGALCLAFGGLTWAVSTPAPAAAAESATAVSQGWKAKGADIITGISDLTKVSNPATVDYDQLLEATPQMKQLKKEKIDPDSPQGKLLRQAANSLITKKCTLVRTQRGYCGIWKAIRHEDGRAVPDVTYEVLAELGSEE